MLQTSDIGDLFAGLRAMYGHRWPHEADAVPIWHDALNRFDRSQLRSAIEKTVRHYSDFPPSLPQFVQMVNESLRALPRADSHAQDDATRCDRVYQYCSPASNTNPHGNLQHITLPESIARKHPGESASVYGRRIADEITFAIYPELRTR